MLISDIKLGVNMACIFCNYVNNKKFIMENKLAVAIYDNFPVNKGHVLIIPKRHFANFFDSTEEEIAAFYDLIKRVKILLDKDHNPDGYNIGININEAAGQTIFHLHIHLIPRYTGDVNNPRGRVRNLKKPLVEYDG
jgi:diadenosine tetraphosphate (Ap4A) HIT family hydrolase